MAKNKFDECDVHKIKKKSDTFADVDPIAYTLSTIKWYFLIHIGAMRTDNLVPLLYSMRVYSVAA